MIQRCGGGTKAQRSCLGPTEHARRTHRLPSPSLARHDNPYLPGIYIAPLDRFACAPVCLEPGLSLLGYSVGNPRKLRHDAEPLTCLEDTPRVRFGRHDKGPAMPTLMHGPGDPMGQDRVDHDSRVRARLGQSIKDLAVWVGNDA